MFMFKDFISSLSVFGQLLWADWVTFRPKYKSRLFDLFIYVAVNVVVMGYLMTRAGLAPGFGMFIVGSCVGTSGRLETYTAITRLIVDLTSNRIISYHMTLPIPSWLAVVRVAISDMLRCLSVGAFVLPFGLIFVWNQFNIANFSPVCSSGVEWSFLWLFRTLFCRPCRQY